MRGRGRGVASGPRPVARDDEGNAIPTEDAQGPPSLYPELELPPPPSEEALVQVDELIKTLSSLNSNYQNSQFYIPSASDRDLSHARDALKSSLIISEDYFPRELWLGAKSVKRTTSGKESGISMRPASLDLSLSRIEELAKREHQTDLTAGSETRMESMLEEKDEMEEDKEAEQYDEDDAFGNDDDPFQQYDDDEEYDDPDADGGDDAYF